MHFVLINLKHERKFLLFLCQIIWYSLENWIFEMSGEIVSLSNVLPGTLHIDIGLHLIILLVNRYIFITYMKMHAVSFY